MEKHEQEKYKKQLEKLRWLSFHEELRYRALKKSKPSYCEAIDRVLEIAGFHITLTEFEKPIFRGFERSDGSIEEGVKKRKESLELREKLQEELDAFSKRYPFVSKDDKEAMEEFKKIKEKYKDLLTIREDNQRRKINRLKSLIQANFDEWTHFITLTFHHNELDIKKAKQHIKKWAYEMSKLIPDFKYIYVMEFQERGSIHFHVLCKCVGKDGVLSKKQFMKVRETWKHGAINIKGIRYKYIPKEHREEAEKELKELSKDERLLTIWSIGSYLTSYLKKGADNMLLFGSKMYGHSEGLKKEIKITGNKEKIAQILSDLGVEQLKSKTYEIHIEETENKVKKTYWNKLIPKEDEK